MSRSVAAAFALVAFVVATAAGAQELMPPAPSGWAQLAPRAQTAPAMTASGGAGAYTLAVAGSGVQSEYGGWTTHIAGLQGSAFYHFSAHAVPQNIVSLRESVTIVLRWSGSFGDEVSPDYVWDFKQQADGSLLFDRTIQT